MEDMLEKVRKLRKEIEMKNYDTRIEIDGGINAVSYTHLNQRYNKVMAHLQSEQLKGKKQETHVRTKRMKRETRKRNNQMDDFMHKKSRKIVDTCICLLYTSSL